MARKQRRTESDDDDENDTPGDDLVQDFTDSDEETEVSLGDARGCESMVDHFKKRYLHYKLPYLFE